VHNDIKPANVLFGLADRRKQVFLVDYGLADSSSSPKCHIFRGNLAFSASRKLRGEYGHDSRNDLQSFIYILLWMLRDGNLPWQQQ
jgi:serine/threonine protein kinase